MMVEGKDFCSVPPSGDDKREQFQLLTGTYQGVIFRYGGIRFEEREDAMHLLFNYDMIDSKNHKKLNQSEGFKNLIGNLLVQMINEKYDQDLDIEEEDYNEPTGTNNTEESHPQ
jgi:hypothetical protein